MKRTLCIIIMLRVTAMLHAQSISTTVIGFTGDRFSNGTASLSGTGGEPTGGVLVNGTNQISQGFQQGYYSYWVGITSTDWNTATNWKGGPVPDANTDAIINSPAPFFPVIVSNVFCRSLKLTGSSTVTVNAPAILTVTH